MTERSQKDVFSRGRRTHGMGEICSVCANWGAELTVLTSAADAAVAHDMDIDYTNLQITDVRMLNPALWPTLGWRASSEL
jgi:hypothetical protein